MSSLTVRITPFAHATLLALAEETDESMTEILDKAIEAYRRQRFLAGLNSDFAALQRNPAAWEAEQAERKKWDATLSDGLEELPAMASTPVRGEVWDVDLDPTLGHEQGGRRSALVVYVDQSNQGPSDLIIAVPISSKDMRVRSHVTIEPEEPTTPAQNFPRQRGRSGAICTILEVWASPFAGRVRALFGNSNAGNLEASREGLGGEASSFDRAVEIDGSHQPYRFSSVSRLAWRLDNENEQEAQAKDS